MAAAAAAANPTTRMSRASLVVLMARPPPFKGLPAIARHACAERLDLVLDVALARFLEDQGSLYRLTDLGQRSETEQHGRVLSTLFRGVFLGKLAAAFKDRRLQFFSDLAHLAERSAFSYLVPLWQLNWVVDCKQPFAGPEQVLRYLSRYTHRVAISDHRLVEVTALGPAKECYAIDISHLSSAGWSDTRNNPGLGIMQSVFRPAARPSGT